MSNSNGEERLLRVTKLTLWKKTKEKLRGGHLSLDLPSVFTSFLLQGAYPGLGHSLLPTCSISMWTWGFYQITELSQSAPPLISFTAGQWVDYPMVFQKL